MQVFSAATVVTLIPGNQSYQKTAQEGPLPAQNYQPAILLFLSCISIRKGGKDGFLRREADLEFDKLKTNAKHINGTGYVGSEWGHGFSSQASGL